MSARVDTPVGGDQAWRRLYAVGSAAAAVSADVAV